MKRGQLTLFIALGLALLLILGLFVLNANRTPVSFQAQQETTAVTNIVQQCLATVGTAGIRVVSSQGGYYEPRTLTHTPNEDTALVYLAPQYVPLWHEIHTCNDGLCLGDHRPALCATKRCPLSAETTTDVSFQRSIEQYIEEELERCADFNTVPYAVESTGTPDVHVHIREQDVLVELDWPLRTQTQDGQTLTIDAFSTTLNVNLVQMYELATKLYALQRQTNVLENIFLQFISVYSGIDRPLPPIRALQTSGTPQYWATRQVQRTIEEDILPFMHFIQIVNAQESYLPLKSPSVDDQTYAAGIYDYLAIKLDDEVYPVGIRFTYPYSGMQLDINGKEFLKPRELPGADFLSIIGGMRFLEYKFKYTASYPLLVHIEDPYAFNGGGLTFTFGLEANIKNNYPVNTSEEITTFHAADTTIDLASPEQRVAHTYNVRVTDKRTGRPVKDTGISYTCGTQYQLGITDTAGRWQGTLPYCTGGALVVEHAEYLNTGVQQDNVHDDRQTTDITIEMWPRHEKVVELYKYTGTAKQSLGRKDGVLVTMTRQKETSYDGVVPYAGILEFGAPDQEVIADDTKSILEQALEEGTITQEEYAAARARTESYERTTGQQVVDLVPGRYDYQAFLTYYDLIAIPEKEECSGGLFEQCVTLNATNFTRWNSGGALLTESDGFVLTEEFVYSERPLVLHVLEQPIPATWDDIQAYEDIETYQSYGRKELVQPET